MPEQIVKPGIYKKMAKVLQKISRVPKNGKNKFFNYDYVTEADLTDHIRPILAEEGVVFTATVLEATKTPPTEKENSKENKEGILSTVKMQFRLVDADDGSFIESIFLGEGTDKGDKGFYKAYTGCVKYFLMKTFLVATGDDPEDDGAPKEKGKPYQLEGSKKKPAETPKEQPKKDKPAEDPMLEELPEKKRLDIIKSTDTLFEQLAHEAETNVDEIKVELLQEFFGVESRKQLRYSQCRELYAKLKNRLIEVQNATV